MPDLNPTGMGELRESEVDYSGTDAWLDSLPRTTGEGSAGLVYNSQDIRSQGIYMLFDYASATITVTDIRFPLMSFDVSGISDAQSATLKVYGNTNSGTGDPSSHSSNGICLAHHWDGNVSVSSPTLNGSMASTTSVSTADWQYCVGVADNNSDGTYDAYAAPKQLATALSSWNVGTSTPNTFTLNSDGIAAINTYNNLQVYLCHKFWIDHFMDDVPFAYGNYAPDGTNGFSAIAGLYHGFGGSQAAYKPVLSVTTTPAVVIPPTDVKLNGGKNTISGGTFKVNT